MDLEAFVCYSFSYTDFCCMNNPESRVRVRGLTGTRYGYTCKTKHIPGCLRRRPLVRTNARTFTFRRRECRDGLWIVVRLDIFYKEAYFPRST